VLVNPKAITIVVSEYPLGPHSVLDRGFSLTQDKDGNLITSSKDINAGDTIITRLKDGELESTVD
jgi:exodeoxyribonuclease VII large subunit